MPAEKGLLGLEMSAAAQGLIPIKRRIFHFDAHSDALRLPARIGAVFGNPPCRTETAPGDDAQSCHAIARVRDVKCPAMQSLRRHYSGRL
jgi:hypothetical protein